MNPVYIVAATRTPIGKAGRGVFAQTRADDLLVAAIRGALSQVPTLDPEAIEDVIVGCAMPEAEQGLNVARSAALLAGIPEQAGGVTVNRFCASSLTAIQMAADRIRVGEADLILVGGVESMSRIPMGGYHPSPNPHVFDAPGRQGMVYGMGLTAEKLAQQWVIGREPQDALALQSHQRASAARSAGLWRDEITPVTVELSKISEEGLSICAEQRTISDDEGIRPDTNAVALARLKPVFLAQGGTVTAGNSSQMSDGAAALMVASEAAVKRFGLTPLVRVVGFSVRGVPPEIMGIGPVKAVPPLLARAGLTVADLDWIELNEAFAAQVLAVQKGLGFDPERLNPQGGAIALGHPLGASGAIRTATMIHGLRRRQGRYGLVTFCVGMGQGVAGLFERV